jgi:hypothetical protein
MAGDDTNKPQAAGLASSPQIPGGTDPKECRRPDEAERIPGTKDAADPMRQKRRQMRRIRRGGEKQKERGRTRRAPNLDKWGGLSPALMEDIRGETAGERAGGGAAGPQSRTCDGALCLPLLSMFL